MPTELRTILFKDAELVQALLQHMRRTGQALPNGQFRSIAIDAPADPTVTLEVMDDREGKLSTLAFRRDEIMAALVTYCLSHNIPLPQDATKDVRILERQIALVVRKPLTQRRAA
ncbi:MAG TPA: hypothetical protein VEH84_11635 [Alphaproteobacteria bacterium]|nr:hypothetical protein [Alphaproteobacteria bacterium]